MVTATAGMGFKDNVFLSNANPKSSPFASGSAELLVLRLAPAGPRVNFFANAEGQFFFDGLSHKEYTAFSQISVEQDFNDTLTGAMAAHYFYQDQILDVSVSETNRQAIPVIGHSLSLEPRLRAQFPGQTWIEVSVPASRQIYNAPLDDYWDVGARLAAGRDYGRGSQLSISYSPHWQPYDRDPARTASGQTITNSHRASFQQDARLVWKHNWDERKHWRTTATLGARWNEENGGGYSDYVRWLASGRVRYVNAGWDISGDGRVAYYDYRNQTVSATDLSKRRRTEWSAAFNVERQLIERLALVLRYEYETIWSNDPLETYSVNTVSASLRLEF
jgi:hypothetical protein